MAVSNTARPVKRHSTFLDEDNYNNLEKLKIKTGLSGKLKQAYQAIGLSINR